MKIDIDIDLLCAFRGLLRMKYRENSHYIPPKKGSELAPYINELLYQKLKSEADLYDKLYSIRSEELDNWLKEYREAERGEP